MAKEQENVRSAGEAGEAREAFHAQVAARLQKLQQRVKASRDTHFGVAQKLAEEKAALKMQRGALSSSKSALKSLHVRFGPSSRYAFFRTTKTNPFAWNR